MAGLFFFMSYQKALSNYEADILFEFGKTSVNQAVSANKQIAENKEQDRSVKEPDRSAKELN